MMGFGSAILLNDPRSIEDNGSPLLKKSLMERLVLGRLVFYKTSGIKFFNDGNFFYFFSFIYKYV